MTYWRGLIIAATFDLIWSMARPTMMAPATPPPIEVVAELPSPSVGEIDAIANREDSLMSLLHEHPRDVDVMLQLADLYASQGLWDAAINPLARALELDSSRRTLWSALDKAVAQSGKGKITDRELRKRAAGFADQVKMYGEEC